jgi:hypothetical protein
MRKCELSPTEENLLDALYQDTINRNKDIVYFYNILQAQLNLQVPLRLMVDGEAEKLSLLDKLKW